MNTTNAPTYAITDNNIIYLGSSQVSYEAGNIKKSPFWA